MVKFGFVTISYRRSEVLHLFLSSIRRLREETDYFICVVVGDEEHKEMCDRYAVHHITQTNHPATAKWNRGVDFLMRMGCEYVCILGSDDILSTELLKSLIAEMDKGIDIIGINTVYFYAGDGKYRGNLLKCVSPKHILGVARCIRRGIIEEVGVPWNKDRSWGMDHIVLQNIMPYLKTSAIVEGVCVDIKTEESLNTFHFWISRLKNRCQPEIFYDIMGEEEKQILSMI
jgi:hypothetical protein